MPIYRFRILIDHESEAFRDIEIGSEQTFLDLHTAIKEAFAFIGQEMACFYVSDENWDKGLEIPLADMGFAEEGEVPKLMAQAHLNDYVQSNDQRFVYAYDFLHMWMFMVELIQSSDSVPDTTYPRVVLSMGTAPDEHSKEEDLSVGILPDDPYAMGDEEHVYDDDDWGDEEDGEDHDEFGHGGVDDASEEFR